MRRAKGSTTRQKQQHVLRPYGGYKIGMFESMNDGRRGSVDVGKEESDTRWGGSLRRTPGPRGLCELR